MDMQPHKQKEQLPGIACESVVNAAFPYVQLGQSDFKILRKPLYPRLICFYNYFFKKIRHPRFCYQ